MKLTGYIERAAGCASGGHFKAGFAFEQRHAQMLIRALDTLRQCGLGINSGAERPSLSCLLR
jgi:hypothetical protein